MIVAVILIAAMFLISCCVFIVLKRNADRRVANARRYSGGSSRKPVRHIGARGGGVGGRGVVFR